MVLFFMETHHLRVRERLVRHMMAGGGGRVHGVNPEGVGGATD